MCIFEPTCCGGSYSLYGASVSLALIIVALNSFKIFASFIQVVWNKALGKWGHIFILVFIGDNVVSVLFILIALIIIVKSCLECHRMLKLTVLILVLLIIARLLCSSARFVMAEGRADGVTDVVRFMGDVSSCIVFLYSSIIFWSNSRKIRKNLSDSDDTLEDEASEVEVREIVV